MPTKKAARPVVCFNQTGTEAENRDGVSLGKIFKDDGKYFFEPYNCDLDLAELKAIVAEMEREPLK